MCEAYSFIYDVAVPSITPCTRCIEIALVHLMSHKGSLNNHILNHSSVCKKPDRQVMRESERRGFLNSVFEP